MRSEVNKTITISFEPDEQELLKAMIQNPILHSDPSDEPVKEREFREKLWESLSK